MEKKREICVKLLSYFMLIVLFAAAFLLPVYGAKRQAAKTAESSDVNAGSAKSSEAGGDSSENEDKNAGASADNSKKIVIDPGHGGDDPGMIGSTGVNERVLNLVYAKKLAALLEEEGFQAVLTRTTEEGLYDPDESNKKAQDMQRRCAIIAEENPILTVSIHQNSYPDASVKGPQVFYYEQSAEGERLAAAIQECMNLSLSVERPRTQKGNSSYYILKRSVSTTVIVECGFLSNPEEEALLQQEEYQDRAVQAICDGILLYLGEKDTAAR